MFYLFYGDNYYPQGGAYDFRGKFITILKAREAFLRSEDHECLVWCHITDTELKIVSTMKNDTENGEVIWV